MSDYQYKCPWDLKKGDHLRVIDIKGSPHAFLGEVVRVIEIQNMGNIVNGEYQGITVVGKRGINYGMNWYRFEPVEHIPITSLDKEINELQTMGYRE